MISTAPTPADIQAVPEAVKAAPAQVAEPLQTQPATKASPAAKPLAKKIAKPVATPVAATVIKKASAKKTATETTAPASNPIQTPLKKLTVKTAVKAPQKTASLKVEKTIKAKKPKMVRDSFTMPKDEIAVIDDLKLRALKLSHLIKKSELIRAGIKALAAMSDSALMAAMKAVPAIKTGRPSK